MTAEDDTEPLVVPGAQQGSTSRGALSGEPNPGSGSLRNRWQSRTYEFASAETAAIYVAVVVALALSAEWWPRVELVARRVRLERSPGRSSEAGPPAEPEWDWWAERLGGRIEPQTVEDRGDER